jgi:hypothetical protein
MVSQDYEEACAQGQRRALCDVHCKCFMGSFSKNYVYAAELYGILMALVHASASVCRHVTIFADNQAALLLSADPSHQPGWWMLRKIHDLIVCLHSQHTEVIIC